MFHALFREENNRLTEALISDILDEKIKIISNMDRHLNIKNADEKLGVMDLKVELEDHTLCNIEVQLEPHKNECERFLYYLANTYSSQLERGKEYKDLNRCISIVIIDHELDVLKEFENLNVRWQMRDNETGRKILTNKFELVIIELPKARKKYLLDKENRLCQWMLFLDDPNNKEVLNIMDKNDSIKDARKELEMVSGDYETRRIAELKLKKIRDDKAARDYAIEKGMEEGMQQGVQQGIQQGIQQGAKDAAKKIARNMIGMGLNIKQIVEAAGLSLEEINGINK